MKFLCKNCFADEELKSFIVSQGVIGECDCCKSKNVEIIAFEELYDFFKELSDNFQIDSQGQEFVVVLQENWNLFSNIGLGRLILDEAKTKIPSFVAAAKDYIGFSDEILENINHWYTLKEELKWKNRYIIDINYLTDELGWDGFFESKVQINKKDVFYRARLHNSSGEKTYNKKQMICPPKEMSREGRANPIGIPYLYLCDNKHTVLYEIRATFLDEVSVANIKLDSSKKETITISDFTEKHSIYIPNGVNKRIKTTLLKKVISRELSKPMRRYDSELDYIPTQFICEFIKTFTGVQGIKFKSSLHPKGNNLVIFDQSLMKCTTVRKVQVSEILIKSNNV